VDSRRVREFAEDPAELEDKLSQLHGLVSASKSIVFFTGAGVSTSAGIADYRGPTGVWTRQRMKKLSSKSTPTAAERAELDLLKAEAKKKGKDGAARGGFGLQSARPTASHMTMSTLVRLGIANHVVTTNLDGLHHKSGLAHHKQLTCLHGDIYIERCTGCGHEFQRDYHVRNKAPRKLDVHDHHIGTCTKCGSKPPRSYTGKKGKGGDRSGLVTPTSKNCGTKDTHINFGESLDTRDWDEAERACGAADLCIVVGTSMSLRHVTHMPFMAKRTVIVNLQKTPDDDEAHLRIFAHADAVLTALMERLKIPIDAAPEPAAKAPSRLPGIAPRTPPGSRSKGSAPAAARGMRDHILEKQKSGKGGCKATAMKDVAVRVEPAAVGVSVRGQEVVKVIKGSQAADAGVQVGWKLTNVNGEEMPARGQAAADAITKALAAGKQQGKPYTIMFAAPVAAEGQVREPKASVSRSPPGQTKASVNRSPPSSGHGACSGGKGEKAFGMFSSGLGGAGVSVSQLLEAHSSMADLATTMASMGSVGAC